MLLKESIFNKKKRGYSQQDVAKKANLPLEVIVYIEGLAKERGTSREGIKKNRNLVNHYKNLNNINRVTTYENFVSQARSAYRKDRSIAIKYKSQSATFKEKAQDRDPANHTNTEKH